MRMKLLSPFAALAMLAIGDAQAQSVTTFPSFAVTGANSTGIVCKLAVGPFVAPLASGTVVGSCVVSPAGWVGSVKISDNVLAVSGLSGVIFNVVVGATPLVTGTYGGETLTANP